MSDAVGTGSPSGFGSRFSPRGIAATVLLLVLGWWLFIADTAADNDVVEGFRVLLTGIGELPSLLFDFDAYRSWWDWMTQAEGWSPIFDRVVQHIQLVATSMAFAVAISIVLGVIVHRVSSLRGPVLGVASIMLTIPSLALFAVFISVPSIGVGDRGPIIALAMYSILPILRNTVIGLEDVDRAVIESAKGMGLNASQRLLRVELPLAWPIILTGIRVATLLNIGIAAIAPLVGGTGLGRYINDGLQRFPDVTSVERMWTGVVFTIVLALVADIAFNLLRRVTTSKGLRS
ncbi:MAG: ABC transporter permease [Ilumatobacter sp.]|jgi:osmoprotectant transport system permease protein|uniref:ABC transporter permease n=1 Tax=Ilumatobacter sp. TaxID=1967498 RepID=UPI00391C8B45